MKLSIVVPCYNEAKNIPLILEAYAAVITRADIEVILVNNGSTDNTELVLTELLPLHVHFLKIVTVPVNNGYGFGILTGLRAATGEFIGWTHGDMQTPPRDVIRALAIIESSNDSKNLYVKGTRLGRSLFDQFFTFSMSIFETIYLKTWLHDINAQPNIFHSDFFATWNNPPDDFSFDLYGLYMAKQHHLHVIRFDVPFLKRIHGHSSWNTGLRAKWKFIKRTIDFSIKLKRKL